MKAAAWNERVAAAQACIDTYAGKPFGWGTRDCVRLAAFLLKKRGHGVSLAKVGGYTTEIGGLRAMRRLGFSSLIEAMDAQGFERIAPAAAWPGDIVALEGPEAWGGALAVKVSGDAVLGALEGEFGVLRPLRTVAAWRID